MAITSTLEVLSQEPTKPQRDGVAGEDMVDTVDHMVNIMVLLHLTDTPSHIQVSLQLDFLDML